MVFIMILIEFAQRKCPYQMKLWEMINDGGSYPIEWERAHRKELEKEFYVLKSVYNIRVNWGGNKGIHS